MRIRWYGQSAFLIQGETSVFADPFGAAMQARAAARGMRFDYPVIETIEPDLLLVTHEHGDHNAVEAIPGSPVTLRSTAGTHASPLGEVVGVASEHDDVAGTQRGPNTIFRFVLDVLLLPAGSGPTVGGEAAAAIVRTLRPRLVVPMHYRTEAIDFLDSPHEFLAALGARVEHLPESEFDVEPLLGTRAAPTVALPAAPLRT